MTPFIVSLSVSDYNAVVSALNLIAAQCQNTMAHINEQVQRQQEQDQARERERNRLATQDEGRSFEP
jgi:hypothetical protein